MSLFIEFATTLDWCGYSLNNRIMNRDQGNNFVSGLENKLMNGVYLILNA